jgi:hypothetical protein
MDAVALLDGVDRDDVWVVELGEGFCLALKARKPLRIVSHFGRKELERDVAAELGVGSAIYLAHTARAER